MLFSLLGTDLGTEQDRPYPPTARRLQQLRAWAAGPHSPAARAAAAGLVVVAGAVAFWSVGRAVFTHFFAAYCAAAARSDPAVAVALAARATLYTCGLAALILCIIAASVWLIDGLIAGFGWAGPRRRPLGGWQAHWWAALRSAAAAGVGATICALLAALIAQKSATIGLTRASSLLVPALCGAFAAALCTAAVDCGLAYIQFLSSARMSRTEMADELRETRGPVLWRVKRADISRRRRHR